MREHGDAARAVQSDSDEVLRTVPGRARKSPDAGAADLAVRVYAALRNAMRARARDAGEAVLESVTGGDVATVSEARAAIGRVVSERRMAEFIGNGLREEIFGKAWVILNDGGESPAETRPTIPEQTDEEALAERILPTVRDSVLTTMASVIAKTACQITHENGTPEATREAAWDTMRDVIATFALEAELFDYNSKDRPATPPPPPVNAGSLEETAKRLQLVWSDAFGGARFVAWESLDDSVRRAWLAVAREFLARSAELPADTSEVTVLREALADAEERARRAELRCDVSEQTRACVATDRDNYAKRLGLAVKAIVDAKKGVIDALGVLNRGAES